MVIINEEGGINKLLFTLFAEELASQKQLSANEIVTTCLLLAELIELIYSCIKIIYHLQRSYIIIKLKYCKMT